MKSKRRHRQLLITAAWVLLVVLLVAAGAAWLGNRASIINKNLTAAVTLVPQLKEDVTADNVDGARSTLGELKQSTQLAREAAADPIWKMAGAMPLIGANFQAISEVAMSADDVVQLGADPLLSVVDTLDWKYLMPTAGGVDLQPLIAAKPKLVAAAHAVRESSDRLDAIGIEGLLPEIAEPIAEARKELASLRDGIDSAAEIASLAPEMMGSGGPRNYLLLVQNNAESRASGGITGALAVVGLEDGKLTLGSQASTADVASVSPALPVDPEQQQIYSSRIGKFIQDVNLTPNFPTAASTARAMWERRTGLRVDGVVSIDPVALSYILEAAGPVKIGSPELVSLAKNKLPTELTGKNVVQTLLSDVYAKIEQPKLQDAYFAGVAQEIFAALSSGKGEAQGLIAGLTRGAEEGRVLVWSDKTAEQSVIAKYRLSGSIAGPSVSPAQFGVYFNDGTGAKMDYYVKRTVQLVKECQQDGYEQTTVRVTSTNTAPVDAATSLPAYVTGDGIFGIPPGSVQTNIVAYGPAQANVETAKLEGERTDFAPYIHSNRPVGVLAVRLAPGESKTVEFTFGKIVQHTEPNVVVTPTVQDVKDVILPTQNAACAPTS